MERRVVITGMGAVTPLGNTAAETWQAAKAGACGIGPITQYDSENQAVHIAGEVKDLDVNALVGKREAKRKQRFVHLALIAAREAMENSGIDMSQEDPYRCGVTVSSGIGGLSGTEENHDRGHRIGFDRVSPLYVPSSISNSAAGEIAIDHGLKGECSCVVSACAGGTNAVGSAYRAIRHGYADVVLAGGTEASITPLGVGGFTVMKALTTCGDVNRASIPFDAERSGFVIAEGAGILVLEELEHALNRGADIIAEVVGYGYTCDAYHVTSPDPTGEAAAESMRRAIAEAGIEPGQVDYINAHGTSTPMNDRIESTAFHTVFGETTPYVSSTKSMTGHLLGAAGAVETIFSAYAIADNFIPPTIHHQVADPECDINLVANEGLSTQVNYALCDSLGFGGHNASVLLTRYER